MRYASGEPDGALPPRPRLRIAVGAAVVLLIAAACGGVLTAMLAPRGAQLTIPAGDGALREPSEPGEGLDGEGLEEPFTVVVHVLGAVEEPGLYRRPEGSRVVDAAAAAGGFAAEADRGALNLARRLADAEQLRVPFLGEQPPVAAPGLRGDGRIDLNTADAATLQTLPRIGPAMAERIIAWRSANGGFRSVEDLLSISGIGERTLEAMRDLVAV